ncbi:MAG: cytochrome c [Solirubrobacterales bacterium]
MIVLVALGGAYEIGYNRGKDRATVGAVEKKAGENPKPTGENPEPTGAKPPATGPGRDLFVSNCSTCHTLAAADASGTVGPNLDDLKPDQARVEAAIANGGTGSGVMPAGLLSGKEAQEVAQYVSSSAGSG